MSLYFGKDDFLRFEETFMRECEADSRVRWLCDFDAVVTSKCSALLSHVSMMVAASAFFLGAAEEGLERTLFLVESAAYIIIAMLLLFAVNTLSVYAFERKEALFRDYFIGSAWRKALIYKIALHSTILVTAALLLTLLGRQLL